jgi:hypothetical protein
MTQVRYSFIGYGQLRKPVPVRRRIIILADNVASNAEALAHQTRCSGGCKFADPPAMRAEPYDPVTAIVNRYFPYTEVLR